MTPVEFELMVVKAVQRVLGGGQLEDDVFEAKRQMPEIDKLAERIGGHANSAHRQPIVWIIGLNEKTHDLHPIGNVEPAHLEQQLASRFDGEAPRLKYCRRIDVPHQRGGQVLALAFETSWPPYVLNRRVGGDWGLVIPFRQGTRVRSARRSEILELLYERTLAPRTRLLSGELSITKAGGHQARLNGRALFILDPGSPPAFLPYSDMTVELTVGARGERLLASPELRWGEWQANDTLSVTRMPSRVRHQEAVYTSRSGLAVEWIGSAPFDSEFLLDDETFEATRRKRVMDIRVTMPVVGSAARTRLDGRLRRRTADLRWTL